ncbi:MAG: hypothetical protein EZS28_036196, partial [Streblomastix strix]
QQQQQQQQQTQQQHHITSIQEQIRRIILSLSDNESFLQSNALPCEKMLFYLEYYFDQDEDDGRGCQYEKDMIEKEREKQDEANNNGNSSNNSINNSGQI